MIKIGFDIAFFSYYPLRIRTLTVLLLFLSPLFAFLSPAATLYVPAQYSTIQAAINAATDTDEIIVSPGTYVENINFGGKNIILRSTNPTNASVVASTIIDGNYSGSVVTFSGTESPSCVLSGFTITNGYSSKSGGILGNNTMATIQNNNINNNTVYSAGLYPEGYGGGLKACDGLIQYNIISGNVATGTYGNGGGLAFCDGTIQNNIISENIRGGLYYCLGTIQNNMILDNSGSGLYKCNGTIQNNFVSGNFAEYGAGLSSCQGTIQNNTIVRNSATYGGGLAGSSAAGCTIRNCIIWGNTASLGAQLYVCDTPSYSCIQDWTGGGTGNISVDPQLIDPASGNFRLQSTSPCIDAGCYVDGLTQDFEGHPRPWDGTLEPRGDGSDYDIGADEYHISQAAVSPQIWSLYK